LWLAERDRLEAQGGGLGMRASRQGARRWAEAWESEARRRSGKSGARFAKDDEYSGMFGGLPVLIIGDEPDDYSAAFAAMQREAAEAELARLVSEASGVRGHGIRQQLRNAVAYWSTEAESRHAAAA
jgi:hypothetical protein